VGCCADQSDLAQNSRREPALGEFRTTLERLVADGKPKPFKWTAKANIILEKNARSSGR
jgi:hypothetical protein